MNRAVVSLSLVSAGGYSTQLSYWPIEREKNCKSSVLNAGSERTVALGRPHSYRFATGSHGTHHVNNIIPLPLELLDQAVGLRWSVEHFPLS
jgi:hypothetical protein